VGTFATPALRKLREGRGTLCIGDASEIKSLGTRRRSGQIFCEQLGIDDAVLSDKVFEDRNIV
jgi:hypothetical protein